MRSRYVYLALLPAVFWLAYSAYDFSVPSDVGTSDEHAVIVFGGDMMFDRYIRLVSEKRGEDFVFSCLSGAFIGRDVVVANLEGPITSNVSVNRDATDATYDQFRFTFPATTAKLLSRYNVKLVNIGNNHILNFGSDGLEETKQFLDEAGVIYFGDPSVETEKQVARLGVDGIPVSFIPWSDWSSDREETLLTIRSEKGAGRVVIVYAHWGEEYVPPPEKVKALARSFVDAGAELVVGSHPHIVQENEMYNGKRIYYSLGNMIFDQYWIEEVREGLLLEVTLSSRGVTNIVEIPTYLESDGRTCPKAM